MATEVAFANNDGTTSDSPNSVPVEEDVGEKLFAENDSARSSRIAGRHNGENWDDKVIPAAKKNTFTVDMGDDVPDAKATKQANTFAAKKTVAQGMMDIALITANANQLRFLVEFNSQSSTFYINIILITLSIFLQVGVGVSLIFKGRFDLKGKSKCRTAKKINNLVVVAVFLVTIINVFVASFTVTNAGALQNAPVAAMTGNV